MKPNDAPTASKVKVDERKLQNNLFNEFLPLLKLSAQDCDREELQLKMHRAIMTLIEVQSGGHLGEDDIARFGDVYGRDLSP